MLNWLTGSKGEHPLTDEKAAKEAIGDLPQGDPFKTLEELTYWLESLKDASGLKITRVYELAEMIDLASKNHCRKLALQYTSAGPRLPRFQENRLFTTSVNFWRALAFAYELYLRKASGSGWGTNRGTLAVACARVLRVRTILIKWQLLRYGPIERENWESISSAFLLAEEKGFAEELLIVYVGVQSTIQREFLQALMLCISSTYSLLPNELEVAERIIGQYAHLYVLSRNPAKGLHYVVDLTAGVPPARFMTGSTPAAGMRFFGAGEAATQLRKLIVSLEKDGALPAGVNLGAEFDGALLLTVLEHLSRYWAPELPARVEKRREVVSRINVVHGFDDILVAIAAGEERVADLDYKIETWVVENESGGGYGAIIPLVNDWLSVGTLLGIRRDNSAAWGVGVVRRVTNDNKLTRHVGIQVLSRGGSVVNINPVGKPRGGESVVLLPSNADDSIGRTEMNFLMPFGSFSPSTSYEMEAYERKYLLVPRGLTESGEDFEMAKFRLLQNNES
jgi:hypothetical protein